MIQKTRVSTMTLCNPVAGDIWIAFFEVAFENLLRDKPIGRLLEPYMDTVTKLFGTTQ